MKEYLNILGFEVRDVVTGFTGIATTVGFELYGCVQVIVTPSGLNDKGEKKQPEWFDFKRLVNTGGKRVMQAPTFAVVPGGSHDKPIR